MKKINIMVVTTSRADYGLLSPLMRQICNDDYYALKLVATGSHLSGLHGKTVEQILKDEFIITDTVDMNTENDHEAGICSSISNGLIGFSESIEKIKPDLIMILGDRYELWSACIAAVIHKIPVAHIHGGEATYGLIDDPIRHSVTKMSSIHFPSIELYGRRIIQMGEKPENVHIVGALGIDNIVSMPLMNKKELSKYTGMDFDKDVVLMTYHPVTLDEYKDASHQTKQVLEALLEIGLPTLITMPNTDAGSGEIIKVIDYYTSVYPEQFTLCKSLGQKAYLSAMNHAILMVGNSSSGIIESASFKLPVVNIGDRQAGRYKPENVIDCECKKDKILIAMHQAMSTELKERISLLRNPYGDGRTADRIVSILKTYDFKSKSGLIKKGFFDLEYLELDRIAAWRVIK